MNGLGKISLILSAVCFILIFGLKLSLAGWMPFMGFGLGFSVFFFLFSLFINFSFYKNLLKSESTQFVGQTTLSILALLIFLLAVNYLFAKNNKIIDMTSNKVNSLTKFTQSIVQSIDEPFQFYYFHTDSAQMKKNELLVKSAIRKYQELSPKILFESYSIFQEPEKAKKFNVSNEESALFALHKGQIHRVNDLSEPSITSGILRLTKEAKTIYFTQGHGERKLKDKGSFGLNHFRKEMKRLHYKLKKLDSFPVPHDASFVAIVGPRTSFAEDELQELKKYFLSGGALFLALDPGESHQLGAFTSQLGVEFQNKFIFDSQGQSAGQSSSSVFMNASIGNELAKSLGAKSRPLFFMASPLKISTKDFAKNKVTQLLSSSKTSFVRDGLEDSGPVLERGASLTAVLVEKDSKKGSYSRLIVTGDSDFLSNQFFSQHANFDVSLNMMSFLSKDKDMVHLRPRKAETTYLIMTQTQINLYFLFFVVPFVAIFFIIAVFLKLRRLF